MSDPRHDFDFIVIGSGFGGSVTPDLVWQNGSWAGIADWKTEMPAHFQTAMRMLGVVENRVLGPAVTERAMSYIPSSAETGWNDAAQ